MKSVEELACAAFNAYAQHRIKPVVGYMLPDWNDLDDPTRAAWVAAVTGMQVPEMLTELHKARAALQERLDDLIESHTHPDTGLITDDADLLAIESDQDLINGIDRVIAQAEGHAPT